MELKLSLKAKIFLSEEMCICLDDLQEHLIFQAPEKLNVLEQLLELLAVLKPPHDQYELGDFRYYENDEYLNSEILDFSENNGIKQDTKEFFIVDSIRHAFISFNFGGLLNLYKHREAENWYPKIIVRKKLGSIDLKGEIVIYRGTSKSEYDSRQYSQSWTLKEKVANDFAFVHYDIHDDYVKTERVVLKSRIMSHHIYYYDEGDNEEEVIIDERELIAPPKIILQKTLD